MNKQLLLSVSLLICFSTYAQEISGKYLRKDIFSGGEESTTIRFSNDSTFEEITNRNLEKTSIRKGNFKFKGDTLMLNFKNPERQEVVIKNRKKINQKNASQELLTNLFINLYDRDAKTNENPIPHFKDDAILHFKDIDGYFLALPIQSNMAFSLYNDHLKSIVVSSLKNNDIKIDLEPLLGYSSTIDIYLSAIEYLSVSRNPQKFIVENLENGYLKFISTEKDVNNWILEKIQ